MQNDQDISSKLSAKIHEWSLNSTRYNMKASTNTFKSDLKNLISILKPWAA